MNIVEPETPEKRYTQEPSQRSIVGLHQKTPRVDTLFGSSHTKMLKSFKSNSR